MAHNSLVSYNNIVNKIKYEVIDMIKEFINKIFNYVENLEKEEENLTEIEKEYEKESIEAFQMMQISVRI